MIYSHDDVLEILRDGFDSSLESLLEYYVEENIPEQINMDSDDMQYYIRDYVFKVQSKILHNSKAINEEGK